MFRKTGLPKLPGTLRKYIAPEGIEKLKLGRLESLPELKLLTYMIIEVKDGSIEEIGSVLKDVISLTMKYNGTIDSIMSSLMLVTSAIGPFDVAALEAALLHSLGGKVRIVSGNEEGVFGQIEGSGLPRVASLIPRFSAALSLLSRTSFGTAAKI